VPDLFRIETDKVALSWGRARGADPVPFTAAQPTVGRLHLWARQPDANFVYVWRAQVPGSISEDPKQTIGPFLYEQTDYRIYARVKAAGSIAVTNRDPVVCRDFQKEDGGRVTYGFVNFGSQVGRSEFTVLLDGTPEFSFEVEVFPSKLDYASDYEQLLAEVQEMLTGLVFEYLRPTYRFGVGAQTQRPSQIEWLTLLRHVAADLERGMQQVARRPIRGIRREDISTRAERVKRCDSAVRSALRRGGGSGAWLRVGAHAVRQRIDERRAQPTLDTPEHCWLATQLNRIRQTLAVLRREEALMKRTLTRSRVLQELDQLEALTARLQRLEPIASAQGDPPPGFASLQLLTAPGYSEAYRSCLALLLGLHLEGGPTRLSVKELNLLYEYWCYLTLLRVISEETGQPIPTKELFAVRQRGLQVLLRRGQKSARAFRFRNGRIITVTYNPLYGSDPNPVLIPQRPDMLVSFEDPGWPKVHLLLDAKYRLDASAEYLQRYKFPGPPEDAINVLHRYRDAILEASPEQFPAGRPKHAVVQAAAVYPFREAAGQEFQNSPLWLALDRIGVGAIPLLPGSEDYLRRWIRNALRRGGWALADHATTHRAVEKAYDWRIAGAEPVLVGVLRGDDPLQHLAWVKSERLYYMPFHATQRRQFVAKYVAIYSPAAIHQPGAVTHVAEVISIDKVRRSDVRTPWPPRGVGGEFQALYRLKELRMLPRAIENARGHPFRTHRWASRLSLERAQVLQELFLETEPEWRLYEDLSASGVLFELEPGPAVLRDPDDPGWRVWFVIKPGLRIRYAGADGFWVRREGRDRVLARLEEVLEIVRIRSATGSEQDAHGYG
jgi:uncharacterized protein